MPDEPNGWIDFRGTDGTHYALPYRDLRSVEMTSEQMIVMWFAHYKVVVRGRNLRPVYHQIINEQVTHLEESDVDWAPETESFVDRLTIEKAIDKRL